MTETARPRPAAGPAGGGVTYQVTATSGYANDVTYSTADGNIEQQTGVSLPWSKTVSSWGNFYEVSAQNSGGGTITCKIFGPNGGLWSRHSSNGEYAVVSCSS